VHLRIQYAIYAVAACLSNMLKRMPPRATMRVQPAATRAEAFLQPLLLLAVLQQHRTGSAQRTDISFDFGWRFRQGLHHEPLPPPPPSPPIASCGAGTPYAFKNASALQCQKLSPKHTAKSAAECEQLCCVDAGCAVWQYTTFPGSHGAPQGCWMGTTKAGCKPNANWVGGERSPPDPGPAPVAPISLHPPEAEPGFDDSNWTAVSAPHDSLIGNSVSKVLCPDGCSGHSYIPRFDSWYRKHFRLPSAWKAGGSAIWLYFHGTFRETTVFLNGKNISAHTSGYTSFAVRLDNQPGLKFGDEENVLALIIDPNTGKTGWWYEGGGVSPFPSPLTSLPVGTTPNTGTTER
jgi:hypothetical protein